MHIGSVDIRIKPHISDPGFVAGAGVGGAAAWRFGIGKSFSMLAPGIGPKIGLGLTAMAFGVVGQNITTIAKGDPSGKNLGLTVAAGAGVAGVGAALLGGFNGAFGSKLLGRPASTDALEGVANAFKYAKAGVGIGAAVGAGIAAETLISNALHRH